MGLKEEVLGMRKEVNEIKEQTWASEIISDYKKQSKRQFIIILVLITMWSITIGYLVYVLNDIGVETTTEESYEIQQDSGDNGNNNFINGNENEVNNG